MRNRLIVLVSVLALVAGACGGDSSSDAPAATSTTTSAPAGTDAPSAARGAELYNGSCVACHGPGGVGVEGLGKPWVGSEFIDNSTDEELIEFLKVGRPADHPENTTGIAMMPRGGNPSLTDEDLADLVAYMRSLNI